MMAQKVIGLNMDDQTVANYWDQNAPAWIEGVRAGYDIYREHIANPAFFGMLPELKGKTVLDIGCGEGYNTRKLADGGAKVIGIDISEKLIRAAQEHENNNPRGITYYVCSGSNLTCFEDASFDAVVSTMALMDMPDYEGCLKEVNRVLKSGGLFQFSILHPLIHIRQFQWICDENNLRTGAVIGDYFGLNSGQEEPDVEKWIFSHSPSDYQESFEPFQVPYFKRTLSQYFNCLTQHNFEVLHLNEPCADVLTIKKFPQMQDSRRLPYFLIFQCRKK